MSIPRELVLHSRLIFRESCVGNFVTCSTQLQVHSSFKVHRSKLQAKSYEFRLRVHSEEFNVTSLS